MKISLNVKLSLLKERFKERKIAKYFKIHSKWSYDTDAATQLFAMRQPIAKFAKKNNLVIDVYNPQHLEENLKTDIDLSEISSYTPRIGLFVTNKKTGNKSLRLIDADTSKIYPKESERMYMCRINGEEDLQISRVVKSTKEDNFLSHIFRTIEDMKKETSKK